MSFTLSSLPSNTSVSRDDLLYTVTGGLSAKATVAALQKGMAIPRVAGQLLFNGNYTSPGYVTGTSSLGDFGLPTVTAQTDTTYGDYFQFLFPAGLTTYLASIGGSAVPTITANLNINNASLNTGAAINWRPIVSQVTQSGFRLRVVRYSGPMQYTMPLTSLSLSDSGGSPVSESGVYRPLGIVTRPGLLSSIAISHQGVASGTLSDLSITAFRAYPGVSGSTYATTDTLANSPGGLSPTSQYKVDEPTFGGNLVFVNTGDALWFLFSYTTTGATVVDGVCVTAEVLAWDVLESTSGAIDSINIAIAVPAS